MKNEGFCTLNVKKLCLIYKLSEKNFIDNGFGFFDPKMENKEVEKFLVENSDDIKENWLKNKISLNFKIVNAPDDWMYIPSTEEEWNDFKETLTIH
jgi:hypothetical protein